MQQWEFPGWGTSYLIKDLDTNTGVAIKELGVSEKHHSKLGEWSATAICGNDILSSCLYVSALSIGFAGILAPLALLMVAGVLYLYRRIYAEVGSALPLNGGTYTVLLNTTSKTTAAAAACLTLLSYLATAVISAGEAMHYLHSIYHHLPVMWSTVGLLGFFAFLNIIGISESAVVALGIFITHIVSLTTLIIFCVIYLIHDPSIFIENFTNPEPFNGKTFLMALFMGFSAAMLGVSGFESSANFIEEQKSGVFPKTLRNMWIGVSVFNPLICLLVLAVLPMSEVLENKNSLLAVIGGESGGSWLKTAISIDAVLVLSGAVLTSYVGVIGLARRMSLDHCLPQVFLKENKFRQTNHWIIVSFFILCCAILAVTKGDVERLAGVYTLSFLSVMALFAIGNVLLKLRRDKMPRAEKASWLAVVIAFFAVSIALYGNMSSENIQIFLIFYLILGGGVFLMFKRIPLLKIFLYAVENAVQLSPVLKRQVGSRIKDWIKHIGDHSVVYFSKGDDLQVLNQAALYVLKNEQANNLLVVHVFDKEDEIPKPMASQLWTIDHIYPELKVDFVGVKGEFGPELIDELSMRLKVAKNNMFIGTPGDRFPHEIEKLGGVRLILG